MSDTVNLEDLRSLDEIKMALEKIRQESATRLMTEAAKIGAAIRLSNFTRSHQPVSTLSLREQVLFLLHDSPGDGPLERERLALVWALTQLPAQESEASIKQVAEIVALFKDKSRMVVRFLEGVLVKYRSASA